MSVTSAFAWGCHLQYLQRLSFNELFAILHCWTVPSLTPCWLTIHSLGIDRQHPIVTPDLFATTSGSDRNSAMYLQIYASIALFGAAVIAAPASIEPRAQSKYPFTNLLAFGDELSDNGNGSFAHGITGNPANVYGYGTWTNGPVAVSYLSTLLQAPLADYAFGGCCGGGSYGATLDNTYTPPSEAKAPSIQDQVANYTSGTNKDVQRASKTLGFIWAGQNDLSKHTDAFWQGDPQNAAFAGNLSSYTSQAVRTLLKAGVPYVLVANVYPKHIAPVTAKYLCGGSNNACTQTWGNVISAANAQLKKDLQSQFGSKVIYYDSFTFVSNLAANAQSYGFTAPMTNFCDGMGDATWNQCMGTSGAVAKGQRSASDGADGWSGSGMGWDSFFWMNFVQPTTRVHALVAADMKKTVDKSLGL